MSLSYRGFLKPLLDFLAAFFLLVALSPFLLIIALILRIQMGSPVLFKQDRLGANRQVFTLVKFRSMSDATCSNGNLLPDLQRTTALGRFLRRTSLDELPELWNVVRGEMSIIGPRPMPLDYGPYFYRSELARFSVRPGVTGLAQVSGRNQLSWDARFATDVVYESRCSFWFDLRICARTVKAVLFRDGFVENPESCMANLDDERHNSRQIDDSC